MAEVSSVERIKPAKPQYLTIPTPSPTPKEVVGGDGGGKTRAGTSGGNGRTPVAAITGPPAVPADSAELIKAIAAIYDAVTQKIAFHEREAARLRESLRPFAQFGNVDPPAAELEFASQDDLTQAVFAAASKLKGGDDSA